MTEQSLAIATPAKQKNAVSVFSNFDAFEAGQRMCAALVSSDLVPKDYQGKEKLGNALIALDVANRMNISPLMVMQNMHIIEGRPGWASSFIISALNASGLFSPLRFKVKDLGEKQAFQDKWTGPKGDRRKETVKITIADKSFIAYAIEKDTGEVLEGPEVTISMAVAEGWYGKPGSKWVTMPDLMGRYRAAAFFGRLYAPHILNGMPTEDEIVDLDESHYKTIDNIKSEAETEPAPASRPKGVQAALKNAASKKQEVKAEPEPSDAIVEAEIVDPEPEPVSDEEPAQHDDVFDAPDDDDDYSPE